MSTPDSTNLSQFDTWLDAFVAGTSTPASRAASDPETSDVREAARQFHGLARRAEQNAAPAPSLSTSWEDFTTANTVDTGATWPSTDPRTAAGQGPPTQSRPRYRGERWHTVLNVALAAVLILAIGTGLWRAADRPGFLNDGNDPGGNQVTGFVPDTTVWTPEPADATPGPATERGLLPTAEECTVEPLTVDEVLWYVADPAGASRSRDMEPPGTPATVNQTATATEAVDQLPVDPFVASPPPVYTPGPASPEQLAGIAEVQRMWMACVLADSPFQRWALQSPELVAYEAGTLFPAFASEDDARQILEEVEATGEMEPSDDFWNRPNASWLMITSQGFPTGYTIALVIPETAYSWTEDGRTFTVSYTDYPMENAPDYGAREAHESVWPETPGPGTETPDSPEQQLGGCSSFELTWFEGRAQLLVSYIPHCG